jgi:hypothetical protein
MPSATGKAKLKKKNLHAYKKGESKEEYFARLSKLDKQIIGKGGDDTWFHFDELFEDEDDTKTPDSDGN